jgi:hypothetical protein
MVDFELSEDQLADLFVARTKIPRMRIAATAVDPDAVYVEGIASIAPEDLQAADDLGYRVKLLTERTAGFRFSVAELRVESQGITARTGRRTSDFWANPPTCPASGKVPFRADFRYVNGLRSSTVVHVPCPRFQR